MTKKPSPFKLSDFLILGGPAILSLVLAVIIGFSEISYLNGDDINKTMIMILMAVVTIAFAGIYALVIFHRKKALDQYRFIPSKHFGIMLNKNTKYKVSDQDILREFNTAIDNWSAIFSPTDVTKAMSGIFWLRFEPHPVSVTRSGKEKLAGYTVVHSKNIVVGYKSENQNVNKTALQHEIGHVIQGEITGWNVEEHHKRSKRLGIR